MIFIEFKKSHYEKTVGLETVFDTLITKCTEQGETFGDMLLDYEEIDVDVLICYMNMSMCGTSNIRFKEKMVYEKLSDAITISEEAFALLVFENSFKRWVYMAKSEIKDNEEMNDEEQDSIIPKVLYQKNITTAKGKKKTAGKWTDKGYKRYNELLMMVRDSRNSNWRKRFEDELQQKYIQNADGKLKAYKRRMQKKEELLRPKRAKVAPTNMFDVMTL